MSNIAFEHITKRYSDGFEAVKDMNINIDDGEFMVLVGPSGSGKSTALRMVAGLEDITEGELKIGNEIVNQREAKDRDVAMVFQNYALYPHMTVRENMGFALKLARTPRKEIDTKVLEAARILGVEPYLNRKPANLSGGQRQRVAMGRAIVRNPKAFLMDEPLSNLDAKLRVQLRTEISRIQQRLGTTTLYVTHDQVEAMTLGDRIAVMRAGRLQQVGRPPTSTSIRTTCSSRASSALRRWTFCKGGSTAARCAYLSASADSRRDAAAARVGAGGRPARGDRRHPSGALRGREPRRGPFGWPYVQDHDRRAGVLGL